MVQVVCGRRGRYSQVKSKKEIMSVTEGSISSLGIISPDLIRSYSFIIPTAVSMPCPIFSPTAPKGIQAQCFYKVSLPMGSKHPRHSSSITEQWVANRSRYGTTVVPGSGLLVTLELPGAGPTSATMGWAVAAGDIGKAQKKHAQSPGWLPVLLLMQTEAVGDLVLQLHIH